MKTKKYLNAKLVTACIAEREQIQTQIQQLETAQQNNYKALDVLILEALLKCHWQPIYNERVVFLWADKAKAFHMWYFATEDGYHRFQEAPVQVKCPHTASQEVDLTKRVCYEPEHEYGWILPISLFEELGKCLKIQLIPDDYSKAQ